MSDLDLLRDADLAPEREEVKEPAKRWFNWWLITRGFIAEDPSGYTQDLSAGDKVRNARPWPSKEIAEQRAIEELDYDEKRDGWVEYLGAFPDEEAP